MSERTCSVDGCGRPVKARGWCATCYSQWHKTGSVERTRSQSVCSVAGCDRTARGRGWCLPHYKRWQRTGDPEGLTLIRRFVAHLTPGVDDCWEWDKPHPESGYGQFAGARAHRWSYEFHVGAIPSGLELDHLCRNRACVNPWHLDPVPTRVNVLRGEGVAAVNARKAACGRGHPFTRENTYWYKSKRECRICSNRAPLQQNS